MVMSEADQKPPKIPGQTLLPMNPIPPGQILVKSETNKTNKYKQPPPIKPNGVPGRRPMLPTVDMDANELLKVSPSALIIKRSNLQISSIWFLQCGI